MQEKVMFVLDAAGDLTRADVENNPIIIVPAHIHIAGREETVDFYGITPQEYWNVLETCQTPPTTSMAPPVEWAAAYKKAYEHGCTHIFVTTVSSTASGVIGSAAMGITLLREEGIHDIVIEPVDNLAYSAMYGHAILRGCEMAKAGVPFAEIVAKLKGIFNKVEAVFGVYTLKYLKRSGRINGVAAFAGEALGLRPILRARGGSIDPCDKVRGDKNIVPALISNIMKNMNLDDPEQELSIIYADVREEDIVELERRLFQHFGVKEPRRFPIGSSVTTNTGPHCLGVSYYGTPR